MTKGIDPRRVEEDAAAATAARLVVEENKAWATPTLVANLDRMARRIGEVEARLEAHEEKRWEMERALASLQDRLAGQVS